MSATRKDKILVVDDDDAIRLMVERVLRREHFEVECARDGFEAIEKLSHAEYGTILLDLMMPRLDGLGVIRFLQEHPEKNQPAVIVMTANLQGADTATTTDPAIEVLAKPFDIRQLIWQIRESAQRSA